MRRADLLRFSRDVPHGCITIEDFEGRKHIFKSLAEFQQFIHGSGLKMYKHFFTCHECRLPLPDNIWVVHKQKDRKVHLSCFKQVKNKYAWKLQEHAYDDSMFEARICYYCENPIFNKRYIFKSNRFFSACKKCAPNDGNWTEVGDKP